MIIGKLKNFFGQRLIELFWKFNCRLAPMDNERNCEYPFVLTRCKLKTGKIADFGSAGSLLVPFFASLGFDVSGIDLSEGVDREFVSKYPNYAFLKVNMTKLSLNNEIFDMSFAISTLEHIIPDAKKALKEIVRVTKKGGQIFISMPYGKGNRNNVYKKNPFTIYNEISLRDLLNIDGISVDEIRYFRSQHPVWLKTEKENIENLDCLRKIQGIVCVSLIRNKR